MYRKEDIEDTKVHSSVQGYQEEGQRRRTRGGDMNRDSSCSRWQEMTTKMMFLVMMMSMPSDRLRSTSSSCLSIVLWKTSLSEWSSSSHFGFLLSFAEFLLFTVVFTVVSLHIFWEELKCMSLSVSFTWNRQSLSLNAYREEIDREKESKLSFLECSFYTTS